MTAEISELLNRALALPSEARAASAGSRLESLEDTLDASPQEEWNLENRVPHRPSSIPVK
jgi:hypothetical protein